MNWLDLLIIAGLLLYMYFGYRHGFLAEMIELIGIAASVVIPFLLYAPLSRLLERFGVSKIYSPAVAFLLLWLLISTVYFFYARRVYRRIPESVRASRANAVAGIIPGLAKGLIVVAIVLTVIASLPSGPLPQTVVDRSLLAPPMLNVTVAVASYASDVFGEAVHNALGFLTVKPEEDEIVALKFRVANPTPDPKMEDRMLELVNAERTKRGLRPLRMDQTLRLIARKHSIDMFRRSYFGHNTPDGVTPFQRMRQGGVFFTVAGENVALAPTLKIAHNGLMRSPGHRENILRPQFRRVGIGIVHGGRYGYMFTQDFTD